MAGGARAPGLNPTPFATGEEVAAHPHQVVGVAVAEVQAQVLLTRRPLPLAAKRAARYRALPHPLSGEVACPQRPGLAFCLALVRPRQQVGVVDPVLRGKVGGQAFLP